MSHLGDYLRAWREGLGLTRPAFAGRLGYRNTTKGVRRIDHLERGGDGPPGFVEAVARVLGVEPEAVAGLAARDRDEADRAWEAWADEPVPVEVVVRAVPGLFARHPLPPGLDDPDEVVAYARGLARNWRKVVVVVLSRRLSVTIGEDGVVRGRNVASPDRDVRPGVRVGRHRFVLPPLGPAPNGCQSGGPAG
ncbi:MAG: helix-turn-helix domain-containing protein [Gemmataceae bacterium]|nr:helix-turn-helix domain-containing protein [Gemmataceae bacterium]